MVELQPHNPLYQLFQVPLVFPKQSFSLSSPLSTFIFCIKLAKKDQATHWNVSRYSNANPIPYSIQLWSKSL